MATKRIPKPNGAPLGNQNRIGLKDSEVRQEAYKDYCSHLAEGRSKRSWCYNKNGLTCTWETMEKYIKNELEFDPLHKKNAESQGYKRWEGVVMDSAEGKNKDANTASLQMLMRNKFGWDKVDRSEEKYEASSLSAVNAFVNQLKELQSSRSIDISNSNND